MHTDAVRLLGKGQSDHLAAVLALDRGFEHDCGQGDLLPVPAHHNLIGRIRAARERDLEIAAHQDVVAIHLEDLVPGLQAARCCGGARRVDAVERRDDIPAVRPVRLDDREHDQKADEEIHQRARRHDQHAARQARLAEGVFALAILVLTLHHARAAEGQQLEAIQRAVMLLFEERGPHTDPKLIHLYPAAFGGDKMPEFVHDNQHAKR